MIVEINGELRSLNFEDNKVVDTLYVKDANGVVLEETLNELKNPINTNRIVDGAVTESKLAEGVNAKINEAFNSPILVSDIEAGSVSTEDKQKVIAAMNDNKQLYFENGAIPVSYYFADGEPNVKEFISNGYYYKLDGNWDITYKGKLTESSIPEQFVTDVKVNGQSTVSDGIAAINLGPGLEYQQSGLTKFFRVKAGNGLMLDAANAISVDAGSGLLNDDDGKLQVNLAQEGRLAFTGQNNEFLTVDINSSLFETTGPISIKEGGITDTEIEEGAISSRHVAPDAELSDEQLATASATVKGAVKVGSGLMMTDETMEVKTDGFTIKIDEYNGEMVVGDGSIDEQHLTLAYNDYIQSLEDRIELSGVADVKINGTSVVDTNGVAHINAGPGLQYSTSANNFQVNTGDGLTKNAANEVIVNPGAGLYINNDGKLQVRLAQEGTLTFVGQNNDLTVNVNSSQFETTGPLTIKENGITGTEIAPEAIDASHIEPYAELSDGQLATAAYDVKGGIKVQPVSSGLIMDGDNLKLQLASGGGLDIVLGGAGGLSVNNDDVTIGIDLSSNKLYVKDDAELSNGQLITASATDKGAIKIGDDFDVNDDKLTFSASYKQYIQSLVTRIENLEEELHPKAVYIDCYPSSIVTAEGGTITINLSNNFDASNMLLEIVGTSFGTLTKIDDRKYEYQVPADMSTSPRQVIVKATAVKDTVIKYTTETIIQKGYVQPYDCWIGSAGDEATAEDFNDSIDKVLQNDNFKQSLTSDSARKDYTIQVGDWEKIVMAFPKSFNITPINFYEGGFSGGVDMTTREIDGIEYNVLYSDAQDPSTHNITIK